jgi:type II secretory pathway component PulC
MCIRTMALALGLALSGCGAPAPSPRTPTPSGAHALQAKVGAAAKAAPLAANAIRRSVVEAVLAAGPGVFLQNVSVDDQPVFLQGKFHGFRIAALQGDSWKGVDLRPGDVVTRVNGFSLEHPEDAAEAFYSLRVASELTVEYERDGEPREIRFGIVDDAPSGDDGTRRN